MVYTTELAQQYVANRENYNETDGALMASLVSVAVANKKILDLGCGDGRHAEILLGMGAKSVVGIDNNATMIELAKKREVNSDTLSFVIAGGDNIPFPDDHFDIVVSNFVLHYFKDTKKVVKEVARVLRQGGYFVCTFNITDVQKGFEHLYNTEMPIRLGSKPPFVVVQNLIKPRKEIANSISDAYFTMIHEEELYHPNAVIDDSFPEKEKLTKHAVMMVLQKPQ